MSLIFAPQVNWICSLWKLKDKVKINSNIPYGGGGGQGSATQYVTKMFRCKLGSHEFYMNVGMIVDGGLDSGV